jgi:hypothetical protein
VNPSRQAARNPASAGFFDSGAMLAYRRRPVGSLPPHGPVRASFRRWCGGHQEAVLGRHPPEASRAAGGLLDAGLLTLGALILRGRSQSKGDTGYSTNDGGNETHGVHCGNRHFRHRRRGSRPQADRRPGTMVPTWSRTGILRPARARCRVRSAYRLVTASFCGRRCSFSPRHSTTRLHHSRPLSAASARLDRISRAR